jgi:hypothetical protein
LEREIARLLRLQVADAVIGKNDPGDLWVTPGPVKLHLCPPRLHRIFTKRDLPMPAPLEEQHVEYIRTIALRGPKCLMARLGSRSLPVPTGWKDDVADC